jgi:hypothetical protein
LWLLALHDIGEFQESWDCGESIWYQSKNARYQGFLISA